ncbi:hypothetical protein [Tabrizicola aquatica]|uniref:hypothetical protein n=1 Tax=Tabrizicola aquatica TaxID=909926 RepID=UPI0015E19FCA|nr:hypothetical protein [Tabrizicola aquatica]
MNEANGHNSSRGDGHQHAREIEGHLTALDSFAPMALGVLAVASGIYTYLGVRSLLDGSGALTFFAAVAYSLAVSVAIFVFWSYMLRLTPAMRTASARIGMLLTMVAGSLAIVAMSSWLNAAALAGSAAVEQHLALTVRDYQVELEQANRVAVAGQGLQLDVSRARQAFADLSTQEADGNLSGTSGRGAVFRVLTSKGDELAALEAQIEAQAPLIEAAFAEGNAILSRMRELTAATGPVAERSVIFAEESVRLAGLIARLRQLSVAPVVDRAAQDLAASVVLPELDGSTDAIRGAQQTTIESVLQVLGQRAESLRSAAQAVMALPAAEETTYQPISTADAVLRYAGDFVPSWAGAIAIDLLPAVLVFMMMVAQSAIREGRATADPEEAMSLRDLRKAVVALRSIEAISGTPRGAEALPETTSDDRDALPEIGGDTAFGNVEALDRGARK